MQVGATKANNKLSAFKIWRSKRPFWAGLFTLIAALAFVLPTVHSITLGDITFSISNYATTKITLLTILVLICGVSLWYRPQYRTAAGIVTIIISIFSLQSANLGGFLVGMISGIIGGALALSWVPQEDDHEPVIAPQETTPEPHDSAKPPAIISHDPPEEEKHNPPSTIILNIVLCLIITATSLVIPRSESHADVPKQTELLWKVMSTHLELPTLNIPGTGTNWTGDKYLTLSFEDAIFTNFGIGWFYKHGYLATAQTGQGTVTHIMGTPGVHDAHVNIRSLTADISFNGRPLGRWTIDTDGIPLQLAELLGLPTVNLPNNISNKLSLDNAQVETYTLYADRITLPQTDVTP